MRFSHGIRFLGPTYYVNVIKYLNIGRNLKRIGLKFARLNSLNMLYL